jgi:hypothetical protein
MEELENAANGRALKKVEYGSERAHESALPNRVARSAFSL